MALHLTDRTIATLPTPTESERQRDYWDDVLRGFGVRVSYGGRRAFVLRYRVNNRLRRLTLGPYPDLSLHDARKKAREVLGDVARGDDPAQDKQERRDAETFRGLVREYLEMAEKRHRSWQEEARIINKDLLPEFGHRPRRHSPAGRAQSRRSNRAQAGGTDHGESHAGRALVHVQLRARSRMDRGESRGAHSVAG